MTRLSLIYVRCSVADTITDCAGTVRENIQLRRAHRWAKLSSVCSRHCSPFRLLHHSPAVQPCPVYAGRTLTAWFEAMCCQFKGTEANTGQCCCRLVCPSGVIASYLHASSAPGLGKMGALVALADRKGALDAENASTVKVLFSACLFSW